MVLSLREDFAANTEFKPQLHIQEVRQLVEELLTWNTALAPLRAAPRARRVKGRKPGARLAAVPASQPAVITTRTAPDRAATAKYALVTVTRTDRWRRCPRRSPPDDTGQISQVSSPVR
jgi:hypothetical protein